MNEIFEDMEGQGIVRTYTAADRDEVTRHGGRKIWALDEDALLDWQFD
jgi:hypothetical protein